MHMQQEKRKLLSYEVGAKSVVVDVDVEKFSLSFSESTTRFRILSPPLSLSLSLGCSLFSLFSSDSERAVRLSLYEETKQQQGSLFVEGKRN